MIEVPLPLGSPLPDGSVCWQGCWAVFSFFSAERDRLQAGEKEESNMSVSR